MALKAGDMYGNLAKKYDKILNNADVSIIVEFIVN